MRFIKVLLVPSFLVISTISNANTSNANTCLTDKYVFDVGSGGINIMGYEVNTCKKIINKTLINNYHGLSIQQCISASADGKTIPDQCLTDVDNAFTSLKKELSINCKQYECVAVATAWARNAKNANILLDKIKAQDINVSVISQQTEGELAFKSFIITNNITSAQKENLTVFDLGGGSFQLSNMVNNTIHVYDGPYGMFNFKSLISSKFADKNGKIDRKLLNKVKDFALKEVWGTISKDVSISQKLKTPDLNVYGVGSFFGKGIKEQLALGENISIEQVEEAIGNTFGKTADEIHAIYPTMPKKYAVGAQFSLLITYGVMKGAGIKNIRIAHNNQFHEYIALNGVG